MVSNEQYVQLKKFKTGSWAIWNKKEINDLKIFNKKRKELHGKVLFLGLNRSGKNSPIYKEFGNFHSKNHKGDKQLEEFFQNSKLIKLKGAYMTDFYKDFQSDSSKMKNKKLSKIEKSTENLFKQIKILKSTKCIICFGKAVFDDLMIGLDALHLNNNNLLSLNTKFNINKKLSNLKIYRVWHYSNRHYPDKIKELKKQLRFINNNL
jgi:hypothetical protein